MSAIRDKVGVVVIGRNEGERLVRCLQSLVGRVECMVYVDSGSSDESVKFARGIGAQVVELDMAIPFNAARARNEGLDLLLRVRPSIEYVQFVDGDSEVVAGWLEAGAKALDER